MDTTTSLASNSPTLFILSRRCRSLPSTRHNQILLPQRSLSFHPISCTSSSNNTNDGAADSVQAAPTATPSGPGELRIRRISKRQARKQRGINGTISSSVQQPTKEKAPPKKWEDMSLAEKAIELYVGEKGALYYLNKFAYASIFIMIGAWILFRFVGPALNIYQLDSPLLSPTDVLKGSS